MNEREMEIAEREHADDEKLWRLIEAVVHAVRDAEDLELFAHTLIEIAERSRLEFTRLEDAALSKALKLKEWDIPLSAYVAGPERVQ